MGISTLSDREAAKRRLRRHMIVNKSFSALGQKLKPAEEDHERSAEEEKVWRVEQYTKKKKLKTVLLCVAVAAVFVLALCLYRDFHTALEYSVGWEREIPANENGYTTYERFGDNVLRVTRDGASYLDSNGKTVWSLSYELKNPITCVNGDYVVIADQQGNSLYICNKSGQQGEATTVLPILKVGVSAYGVTAALVEDSTASYVTFFKSDGSELDWTIKTVMSGNGYLMDVSVSPDGSQVMLSDLYLQDGGLKNRLVFYNFSEYGKSYPDRLVGGFDELADRLIPKVRFLDDSHACAFSDGVIAFFSLENVTSPDLKAQVAVPEEIMAIAYGDKYVALITDNPEGEEEYLLQVFKSDGTQVCKTEFTYQWQNMDIEGKEVIIYNDNSCMVFSVKGRERFEGEFDFPVAKVTRGKGFNNLLVTGGSYMRQVKLK